MSGQQPKIIGLDREPPVPRDRIPFRCPVCDGRGEVPVGFYLPVLPNISMEATERCRTCRGTGIVWN